MTPRCWEIVNACRAANESAFCECCDYGTPFAFSIKGLLIIGAALIILVLLVVWVMRDTDKVSSEGK